MFATRSLQLVFAFCFMVASAAGGALAAVTDRPLDSASADTAPRIGGAVPDGRAAGVGEPIRVAQISFGGGGFNVRIGGGRRYDRRRSGRRDRNLRRYLKKKRRARRLRERRWRLRQLRERRAAERLRERRKDRARRRAHERRKAKRDRLRARQRRLARERKKALRQKRAAERRKARARAQAAARRSRALAKARAKARAAAQRQRELKRARRMKRLAAQRQRAIRRARLNRQRKRARARARLAEVRHRIDKRKRWRKRMRRLRLSILRRKWWRRHCGSRDTTLQIDDNVAAGTRAPLRSKKIRRRCGSTLPELPDLVGLGVGIGIGIGSIPPGRTEPDPGHDHEPERDDDGDKPVRRASSDPVRPPLPSSRRAPTVVAVPVPTRRNAPTPPPTAVVDNRYWPDQIVVQIDRFASPALDDQIGQAFNLQRLSSETNLLVGRRVVLYRVPDRRDVIAVSAQLAADPRVSRAQPNWRYDLSQQAAAATEGQADGSDASLYAVRKIKLSAAHGVSRGRGIRVAVIDSGVDGEHAELRNGVLRRFDATRGAGDADPRHGTAIAGIIRARGGRITAVAPDAELLSARAFFTPRGGAAPVSSTVILMRALDWSVANGARVINMSFAGPPDRDVSDAIDAAAEKGVVLVAAAGNGGPKAKPAYPAAYDPVIAVTATDIDDRAYVQANRGSYLAVAAPGVDVMVLKPRKGHTFSSGTSMAAAHVTGLIALVLERNDRMSASEIRGVLMRTARDLGERGLDRLFGAGRVDAGALLQAVAPRQPGTISVVKQTD